MDPQATWKSLIDACQARDWPLVAESAEALLAWLAGGGFPPRLDGEDELRRRLIVQLCCEQALTSTPPFDYES